MIIKFYACIQRSVSPRFCKAVSHWGIEKAIKYHMINIAMMCQLDHLLLIGSLNVKQANNMQHQISGTPGSFDKQ